MIHNQIRSASLGSLFVLFVIASMVSASTPVYFELTARSDIEKGDASGISIAENGTLTLAPTFDIVFDTEQTYVWSSVADSKGNIYLGTGHDGRIYVVSPGGAGRLLVDTAELDVTALAVDPSGSLYAATSPDGKIYRIQPDGTSAVFFDPDDKYIWSLAFFGGNLYAGTGEKGIIYKISQDGRGEAWVDTDEVHVVSLATTPSGDLLAGTDPNSLVLRIGADGKPFTILDTPLQETHALSVAPDGSVYALAIASTAATTSAEQTSVAEAQSNTTTVTKLDLSAVGTTEVKSRRDTEGAKSAVYRILPDGSNDVVWRSGSVVAYAIRAEADRVLVGTGDRGRVYSVDPVKVNATLLVQSAEDQTSTFVARGSELFAASNNLGKLFKLGPQAVARGTYESPVHDAKSVSKWGRIVLRAAGSVELESRSGNTESPDSTWSSWSKVPLSNAAGTVQSPAARYLQWRLTMAGPNVRVQSVAISYLPNNLSPEITSLTVLPAGIGLQELPQQPVDPGILSSGFDPTIFGFSTNLPPRRVFQKGARSLIWQAKDPDDDRLTFSLFYRGLTDSNWRRLADNFTNSYYTIDSDAVPDGVYIFRLVVADSSSNPAAFSRTGEYVTEPVEIDNSPPAVSPAQPTIGSGSVETLVTVEDSTSRIVGAEYSVDGGPWMPVYPEDGIPDNLRETYRVRVTGLSPGEHTLAFRAADSNNNVGSGKVNVVVR